MTAGDIAMFEKMQEEIVEGICLKRQSFNTLPYMRIY